MFDSEQGIGRYGERIPGPPWILGHRGSPLEAPENTLASLRRALDLGLDGVEYDLHACATGEAILIHDATLERTTDSAGPVAERTLPELFGIDAGGWFHKRFAGEPLAVLDEALDLPGASADQVPLHMIELKEEGLVGEVARQLRERTQPLSARVASFRRGVCLEARDAGLEAMLLATRASEEDRRFVRDERLAAYGVGPGGFCTEAGRAEWPCERWSWSLDEPADLLEACRAPLFGLNTNEPRRALSVRALVALAPDDDGDYPLQVPHLEVTPGALAGTQGEWCGEWSVTARVRNPFGFPVRGGALVEVRRGAFETRGLPAAFELLPGAAVEVPFVLRGGSWSPGGDPVLVVLFRWDLGPGRPAGQLALDAPLHRRRSLRLDPEVRRLAMLRERPGEAAASMTLQRSGHYLLASIENDGGLTDARALVNLDGVERRGSRGVRALLPEDFELRSDGVGFSCGFAGRDERGELCLRRWAGGLPPGVLAGAPGRLLPLT